MEIPTARRTSPTFQVTKIQTLQKRETFLLNLIEAVRNLLISILLMPVRPDCSIPK